MVFKSLFMFLNELFLGIIWGLVCGFLEGRKTFNILRAVLSASFILTSGYVKQVGRCLMNEYGISEVWIPFNVGLILIPLMLVAVLFTHLLA